MFKKTRPVDVQSPADRRRNLAKIITQGKTPDVALRLTAAKVPDSLFNNHELLQAIYGLCEKLVPLAKEIEIIVGDDASGRLPSLLIKHSLDAVRQKMGLPPIPIRFIASGRSTGEQTEAVRHYLEEHKSELASAVIVTEFMSSGESMAELVRMFRGLDLEPIVAAVSIGGEPEFYREKIQAKIIYGQIGQAGLDFYGSKSRPFSGVNKKMGARDSAHSEPTKKYEAKTKEQQIDVQRTINAARDDVALVGEVFSRLLARRK